MSQPIQPQQPLGPPSRHAAGGHLPPPIQPPPQPLGPPPIQGKPPKQKRFGFLALIITALVSLGIGGAVGGSGDGATTAAPAPTTTVTEPAAEAEPAPTVTVTKAAEPEPEPEPEPTEAAPAKWDPKPKDFKVSVKVTDKQCFGSAGCSITYKVALDYLGTQDVPADGTTDITYKISGAEGPIIGTLTLNSEGKFDVSEEIASTTSSSKKLVAKVTEVAYNEFG